MVDIVTRVNNVVNGFVWGPFGLALLLCTGLWLSVRTGFSSSGGWATGSSIPSVQFYQ